MTPCNFKKRILQVVRFIDRGRYLKVGGQTGIRTNAVLESGGTEGGRLFLQREFGGFISGKFWNFNVQNDAFGGKIALRFDYKQTAIFTQSFRHK